jgi:hypothetical protein
MLRRTLTGLLTAALLVGALPAQAQVLDSRIPHYVGRWRGPCSFRADGEADTGRTPIAVREAHGETLVRCVFDHLLPDQTEHALYVANRESHFLNSAYNPSGCSGIFQHQIRYWPGRVLGWLPRAWLAYLWRKGVSVFNSYANVWVAAFMVKDGGWGPWGG